MLPEKKEVCAHEQIMQQVATYPEAPAICSWDGDFTYRKLNRLSNRLAHHLVSLGVGPEVIVPLCFEKSAWAIVAMLAVMKAGGAIVFLDASHPMSRIEEILQQVGAEFVLVSSRHSQLLASRITVHVINRDVVEHLPFRAGAPITNVKPTNVLYVIFTSGSTGTPKGCLVEHASFCSGVIYQRKFANFIQCTSRVLQLASYSFDVSILEIVSALMIGACICVPSQEAASSGIANIINDMEINWAFLTPSLVRIINPEDVPGMKTLVLGGEALSRIDVETWSEKLQLVNGYGPSECSIAATCNPSLDRNSDPANIGRPMGGLCWVVDPIDHNRLVPIGAVGELLVEGPILARGYLNNPEKTAAAFIRNPTWLQHEKSDGPRRLYKTGDLVRNNPDGTIHFIGRKDTQVKLRGQRIELGDIEHHLYADSRIHHAMVIRTTTGCCKDRLVAVVTLKGIAPPEIQEAGISVVTRSQLDMAAIRVTDLRDTLMDHVPNYMVPTTWIVLHEIPLTISGKMNRMAVKTWVDKMDVETFQAINDLMVEKSDPASATDMESKLQEAFSHVLDLPVDQVTMDLSFLSLGGDSISAMQLMSYLRADGIDISVRDILRSRNIRQLALSATPAQQSTLSVSETKDTPFSLSPIQQMFFAMTPDPKMQFNQSFLLRTTDPVSPSQLGEAINLLVQQHSMLRCRFRRNSSGEWTQLITSDISGSYRYEEHEVDELSGLLPLATNTQNCLDIENGPMLAADLFNVDGEGQLLYLVAHHLVLDLVSWRLILADLGQLLQGGSLPLEKPFPFQAWCQLQAEYARDHLNPQAALPFDIPAADYRYWGMVDKPNTYKEVVQRRFEIDARTTAMLLGSCHKALRTEPLDIFLAALVHSFRQTFPDRMTPAVFSEGHGREPWTTEIDLSRTVGWFTTISPLHVRGEDDIVETVRRTKDIRRQLPVNGWPYFTSRFLNADGQKAFKDHWPIEILFNYQGLYQQLEREESLLQIVPLSTHDVSSDMKRLPLFDVSATVTSGVAALSMTYCRNMAHQAKIVKWMAAFKLSLHKAIHQLAATTIDYTLSDFPLLPVDYSGLAVLKKERLPRLGIQSLGDVEDVYPCSPMQEAILSSQQKKMGFYEIQTIFELTPLNPATTINLKQLHNAWQSMVDRHSVLRTIFVESITKGSKFNQVVLKDPPARILHVDAGKLHPIEALRQQPAIDYQESRLPHRLTTCKTSSGQVFCRAEISHAVIDGASMVGLLREFGMAYEGKLSDVPAPLYSDYISYIQKRDSSSDLEYWVRYLADLGPCQLPIVMIPTTRRELRSVDVELDQKYDLNAFCKTNSITTSNLLRAAWALVLRCHVGVDDVSFGYLMSGGETAMKRIHEAVGPFFNMLVCRQRLSESTLLTEVLKEVQTDSILSLPYQECFVMDLCRAKNTGALKFNTMMNFRKYVPFNSDESRQGGDGMEWKPIRQHDPFEVSWMF